MPHSQSQISQDKQHLNLAQLPGHLSICVVGQKKKKNASDGILYGAIGATCDFTSC